MTNEKKDETTPTDTDAPKGSSLSGWGRIFEDIYKGLKGSSAGGIIVGLVYLFTKDERGREFLIKAVQLTKTGIGIGLTEIEPLVEHVKGWTKEQIHHFQQAINLALGTLIVTGAVVVMSTAFIHPMLWKAIAALGSSFLVMFTLHTQFVRVWPLIMALGLADGTLTEGSKLSLAGESIKSFPGMLIGGLRRGGLEGLGWIGQIWRYIALTCVWFTAGDIYITVTDLYKAPALIFLGLMTVPILTFIPLALRYKKDEDRGPQFNTLMYICGFILLDIFVWCNLYDDIQVVLRYPDSWIQFFGRLALILIALWEIGMSIYLSLRFRSKDDKRLAGQSGPVYSSGGVIYTKAPPMPHNNVGWIVSGLVICFLAVTVTWIATNGTLPGFPKGPDTPTPHQQKVAVEQMQKAQEKFEAAQLQYQEMQRKLAAHDESTSANY